jgi:hypothetical protein
MSAFNPTQQEVEERASGTSFGRSLSGQEREAFVRDMVRVAEKMPSPPKAALIGAGIGAAIALISGRSVVKYGLVLGAISYAGMATIDGTFMAGYAMGFGAGKRS